MMTTAVSVLPDPLAAVCGSSGCRQRALRDAVCPRAPLPSAGAARGSTAGADRRAGQRVRLQNLKAAGGHGGREGDCKLNHFTS